MHKIIFTASLACLLLSGAAAQAQDHYGPQGNEDRTVHRSVDASPRQYPQWLRNTPEHYEFSPLVSNHDPQNSHPQQWEGQDWDTSMWNANWTPDVAIAKFYAAGIFEKQYRKRTHRPAGDMLVVDVGPTFFKLSELDQNRTLKLLTDSERVFDSGYPVVEVRDGFTSKLVGTYTPRGLQLF